MARGGQAEKEPRVRDLLDRLRLDPATALRIARYGDPTQLQPVGLPEVLREPRLYVAEPRDWYAGYLGVRGEVDLPYELRRDLKEQVPQALLRDLFRPLRKNDPVERVPLVPPTEGDGEAEPARAQVRVAMAELRRPLPYLEPLSVVIRREAESLRAELRLPVRPPIPDDAPRHQGRRFGAGL